MKPTTFIVHCTKTLNGTIEVEATTKEEAVEKVQREMLDEVEFYNGDTTADYAEVAE